MFLEKEKKTIENLNYLVYHAPLLCFRKKDKKNPKTKLDLFSRFRKISRG